MKAALSDQPLVTIITPTFNRSKFIERCARSILDQTYKNIEYIIVDGASTDGSIEIFRDLATCDPRVKFISEPDEGEVYAVNKGLKMATGEIVGVLNSDDIYLPDAVEKAVDFLVVHPDFIGVSGDARYVDEKGKDLGRGVITYRGEMSKATLRKILILRHKSTFVCHGAFFGWRRRLAEHGEFDPAFSVMPDLEFYSRLLDAGEKIGSLARVQYYFTIHPDMGALRYVEKVEQQRAKLHARYKFRWYHEFLWLFVGKFTSYISNPYRSPFWQGVRWELQMARARLKHR